MFTHTVMSRTVEQLSCIFDATVAGITFLDSAIGDGFFNHPLLWGRGILVDL